MKNGKVFGKINIIDFLVVLVIVVVIAGIGYRLFSSKGNEATDIKQFEFVVRVEGVRDMTIDALEKKGKVYASKNNIEIGEITDVKVEPFMQSTVSFEGKRSFIEVPEYYTAYITISSEGTISNGQHYDNDKTAIDSGRGYVISSRHVATHGEIVSITDK